MDIIILHPSNKWRNALLSTKIYGSGEIFGHYSLNIYSPLMVDNKTDRYPDKWKDR